MICFGTLVIGWSEAAREDNLNAKVRGCWGVRVTGLLESRATLGIQFKANDGRVAVAFTHRQTKRPKFDCYRLKLAHWVSPTRALAYCGSCLAARRGNCISSWPSSCAAVSSLKVSLRTLNQQIDHFLSCAKIRIIIKNIYLMLFL